MNKIYGDEKPSLDELKHFGVVGMKWGVRRGKSKSGVGRIRGAAAQGLQDEARRRRSAASSGAKNVGFNLMRGTIRTRKGQLKTAEKQELAAKHILAGKTTVRDYLRANHNVSLLDLAIKTTPTKGNNRG